MGSVIFLFLYLLDYILIFSLQIVRSSHFVSYAISCQVYLHFVKSQSGGRQV